MDEKQEILNSIQEDLLGTIDADKYHTGEELAVFGETLKRSMQRFEMLVYSSLIEHFEKRRAESVAGTILTTKDVVGELAKRIAVVRKGMDADMHIREVG